LDGFQQQLAGRAPDLLQVQVDAGQRGAAPLRRRQPVVDTDHGGSSASAGAYVGQIDNTGDPRTASYVDFVVNVPAARAYTMRIGYANATGATATHGLAYNGGAWSMVSYPPTGAWGQFGATVSTSVNLRAGYNVIRLAKGSPYFGGGTGYAELDYIELT
jgi:hypothetical protein